MIEKNTQNQSTDQGMLDSIVEEITQKIVALVAPSRVILYNCKQDFAGELLSFKLCVIGSTQEKSAQIRRIFAEVDSDIPYDVLIYTDEQFDDLRQGVNSFAHFVDQRGKRLYGN